MTCTRKEAGTQLDGPLAKEATGSHQRVGISLGMWLGNIFGRKVSGRKGEKENKANTSSYPVLQERGLRDLMIGSSI